MNVKFDLAFVDGPPTTLGSQARYPFIPLLNDKMSSNCIVIIDDAIRQDEKDIISSWESSFDVSEYVALEKGAHILSRK